MPTRSVRPRRDSRIARSTRADESTLVTRGSGNVYADLGFANPDEELAKAELARLIDATIRGRGLTQQSAAMIMGVDQPKVSHILRGRLGGISTQRLLGCLTALGSDVEITVRPAPRSRKRGRLSVTAR